MHFSRIQGKRVFNSALSIEAPHERAERFTVENMPNSAFGFSNLGSPDIFLAQTVDIFLALRLEIVTIFLNVIEAQNLSLNRITLMLL